MEPDEVGRLVDALVPVVPFLGVAGPEPAAVALGWSVRGPADDRTVRAWAGADVEPLLSVGSVRRGWRRTVDALVAVTVVVDEASAPADRDRVLDSFAAAASPLYARFGDPIGYAYGPVREIVWSLGDSSRAVLALVAASEPASVRLAVRLAESAPGVESVAGPVPAPADGPGDWDRFTDALAIVLVDVTEDRELVLSGRAYEDRYVRFGPLWAETPGPCDEDLGWVRFEPDGDWIVQVPWPPEAADYRLMAGIAVSTLRDAHGAASPADLVLEGRDDPARHYSRLGLANRHAPVAAPPAETQPGCLLGWLIVIAYLVPFMGFVVAVGVLLAALTDTTDSFVPLPVPVAAAVAAGCYAALVALTRLRRRRPAAARPLPVGLAEVGTLPILLFVPVVGVSLGATDTEGPAGALTVPVGLLICAALLTTVLRRAPGPTVTGVAGWIAWAALALAGRMWASVAVGIATVVAVGVYAYRRRR